MISSYSPIGKYIKQSKDRNTAGFVNELRGVSIEKFYMPSVANIHGVDLSKYKVVNTGQFAFNPMHVGRDKVLPISLLDSLEPVIISPAYTVFEIINEDLLPDYLMIWFRRPEFDRNAWFKTDGNVRGGLSWDDFCEIELPVPSLDEQIKIVKEYETVVSRMKLNNIFNKKLDELAQAVYKQWFIDFEFPMSAKYAESIGKPDLTGMPYKSAGGSFSYNALLHKEIPIGWMAESLSRHVKVIDNRGKTPPNSKIKTDYPLLEISSLRTGGRVVSFDRCNKYVDYETYTNWFRSGHPKQKDILFSTVGSLAEMKVFWGNKGCIAQNIVGFRSSNGCGLYLYQYLANSMEGLLSYEIGSVQASIKVSQVIDYDILVPEENILIQFERLMEIITAHMYKITAQSDSLREMKQVIMNKVSMT